MDHSKDEPQVPPEFQKKFNKQMDELWFNYLEHCVKERVSPVTRDKFAEIIKEKVMGMVVERKAERIEDWSEVYVVAAAVRNLKMPVTASAIITCSQCGQSVWISPQLKDRYKKAKGVICTECAPEMTGKSMETLLNEDLN